jgi:hypothetical protein
MISDRIRKIVAADHDNQQLGKVAGAVKRCGTVFSTKDADRPYKLIGVIKDIYRAVGCNLLDDTCSFSSKA